MPHHSLIRLGNSAPPTSSTKFSKATASCRVMLLQSIFTSHISRTTAPANPLPAFHTHLGRRTHIRPLTSNYLQSARPTLFASSKATQRSRRFFLVSLLQSFLMDGVLHLHIVFPASQLQVLWCGCDRARPSQSTVNSGRAKPRRDQIMSQSQLHSSDFLTTCSQRDPSQESLPECIIQR